jgi:signal transduction histidine kinase
MMPHSKHRKSTVVQSIERAAEQMREPLASVIGFAELLLTQDYDDTTRRELTATLLAEAEALADIINRQFDTAHLDDVPALKEDMGEPT